MLGTALQMANVLVTPFSSDSIALTNTYLTNEPTTCQGIHRQYMACKIRCYMLPSHGGFLPGCMFFHMRALHACSHMCPFLLSHLNLCECSLASMLEQLRGWMSQRAGWTRLPNNEAPTRPLSDPLVASYPSRDTSPSQPSGMTAMLHPVLGLTLGRHTQGPCHKSVSSCFCP